MAKKASLTFSIEAVIINAEYNRPQGRNPKDTPKIKPLYEVGLLNKLDKSLLETLDRSINIENLPINLNNLPRELKFSIFFLKTANIIKSAAKINTDPENILKLSMSRTFPAR